MSVRDLGEFPLIARLTAALDVGGAVLLGPGDDAAIVQSPACRGTLLTCDVMVEGVHFLKSADPFDVGYKLMTANVSDIAAMGGSPLYALVTLVLPTDTEVRWVDLLYNGISSCAREHGVYVVGGDVSSGGNIVLNVALMGCVDPDSALLRSAAKPGDIVMVTGALGAAQVGLQIHKGEIEASGEMAEAALSRHLRPAPRLAEAQMLASMGCRTANDISDGLASEAREIADASLVAIYIEAALVPIHPSVTLATHDDKTALDYALYSGEEYELLFTVSPTVFDSCREQLAGFTRIGTVAAGRGVYIMSNGNTQTLGRGHVHFSGADKE